MRERLVGWHLPEGTCSDAILIASELTTNALVHTLSRRLLCGVGLVTDECLRLEVHDQGDPYVSPAACEPDSGEESGRGLLLVHHMASAWGCARSTITGGNAVWATMSLPSGVHARALPPRAHGTAHAAPGRTGFERG
ncbi:ATP-binding protein [Streptomyces sp. NPDC014986]|uniref:ATP-binding protein n=1 Tax=Streptomyces sp. NPDC014986 TaxID=3364934 RepID=UPI00370018CE